MLASAWLASSSAWTHASRADRDRGALAERHRHLLGRSQLEAGLDGVGEEVVGLVGLACQQPRDRRGAAAACGRPRLPGASSSSASSASARILATPRWQRCARRRASQESIDALPSGRPPSYARELGRAGPALRLRRPAPERGEQRAEHGRQRVALESTVCLQPLEPALGGRHAAALVRGRRALLDQPRHAVDVAGLLRVADRPLRVPVRLAPVGCPRQEAGHEIGLGPRRARIGAVPGRGGDTGTTPRSRSSGTRNRLERASDSSVDADPLSSRTASHSGPDSRSSTEVRVRKRSSSAESWASSSDCR